MDLSQIATCHTRHEEEIPLLGLQNWHRHFHRLDYESSCVSTTSVCDQDKAGVEVEIEVLNEKMHSNESLLSPAKGQVDNAHVPMSRDGRATEAKTELPESAPLSSQ